MKFQSGDTILDYTEEKELEVEKTMREVIDPANKLSDLQGSFVDQVEVDEDGNVWIYFGEDVISINYSCYGGVFVNDETK